MQFRVILASLLLASTCALAADIAVVEEIVAKVNGDIITRGEIDRDRKMMEAELRRQGAMNALDIRKEVTERSKDLLRERIDGLLLVSKAKELSISVESEVSKYVNELKIQAKIADDEKFAAYVRENTGQSLEDFKSDVRNNMLRQRVVREQVGRTINIPRAEVEKYYNDHKAEFVREEKIFLREITLLAEGKDAAGVAAVEKKAKDIAARARKGERFAELAKSNSESGTKDQYGELGGFKKGELDKGIEALIWDKERGHVTEPIKRGNGFIILRVEDHQKEGQADLADVENDVMEKLYTPRFTPKIREYLTTLRQDAFLEIKEGYMDSGAAPGKETKWSDPAQLKPETVTKEEVAGRSRRKRLLWAVPIPGTSSGPKSAKQGVSASK